MSGSLNLNNQLTNELIAISEEYGMRDFLAMGYDEKDTYFNQSLQTKGYYGSDLFIFSYELADSYQGMGLYAELDDRYLELSNEHYYEDGKLVGLKISDEYYIFKYLGTKEFITLYYLLRKEFIYVKPIFDEFIPLAIMIKTSDIETVIDFIENKIQTINEEDIRFDLQFHKKGKYDEYIPEQLLKKAFLKNNLNIKNLK